MNNIEFEDTAALNLLLDWAIQRKKNAYVTSVEVVIRELGITRPRAVKLFRYLDDSGQGHFIVGRHRRKSRLTWNDGVWAALDRMTGPTNE